MSCGGILCNISILRSSGIFLIISFGYYPSLSSPRTVGGHNGTPGAVPPPVGARELFFSTLKRKKLLIR